MSDRLGMGAMISMLRGNDESVDAYNAAIGKTISALRLDNDSDPEGLRFTFTDGTAIMVYDDAQSCCESRYMRTDDDLAYHVTAELRSIEVREGGKTEDDWGGVHEIMFLHVTTSKGNVRDVVA